MNLSKRATFLAAQLALMPVASQAHDYWVMPSRFDPSPATLLEARFTSSHHFFVNESVPDVTKFRGFLVRPDGREIALPYQRVTATEAIVTASLSERGTYVLGAVSTQPEYWSTTKTGHAPGKKAEIPDAISTTQYVKSIKTFLTVGQPSEGWGKPLGHAIEVVPQANPASLNVGDVLPLKVLLHAQPAAGAEVFAVYEGFESEDHEAPVNTTADKEGKAQVKLDRPGLWLVYARVERPAAADTGLDRENYRGYLLMKVAAASEGAKP
jgi:uncharacterized GH25 family protein